MNHHIKKIDWVFPFSVRLKKRATSPMQHIEISKKKIIPYKMLPETSWH